MLSYQCHPAVEEFLKSTIVREYTGEGQADIHFITTYLPDVSNSPHEGLNQAVHYRLQSPNTYIVLLSFLTQNELKKQDKYGLLSLPGTLFLRLPIGVMELFWIWAKCITPLRISASELKTFAIKVYPDCLKNELSKLKHGGQWDIGNKIIYPLRTACLGHINNPSEYQNVIGNQMQKLHDFISNSEINNFLIMTEKTNGLDNDFLKTLQVFAFSFRKLDEQYVKHKISVVDILNEINNFSGIYNKLSDT